MVDRNLRVRVADFGFARLKESGRSAKGKSGGYTSSDVGPIKVLRLSDPKTLRPAYFSFLFLVGGAAGEL